MERASRKKVLKLERGWPAAAERTAAAEAEVKANVTKTANPGATTRRGNDEHCAV
jgi:hypothetical protein